MLICRFGLEINLIFQQNSLVFSEIKNSEFIIKKYFDLKRIIRYNYKKGWFMKILVADDDFTTIRILSVMLEQEGFELVLAEDGLTALDILQQEDSPKIAVLDWRMPGLTGIEVIKELRKNQKDYVYCILLTAKTEKQDFEEGFNAGADDFLTKPINNSSIKQRLNVAKRIVQYELNEKQMRTEILNYANSMKELAEERAKQLIHADRLATLGTLAAGIAHEINNPTTFIAGNIQSLEKYWDVMIQKGCLSETDDRQIALITEHFPKIISGIRSGVKRITKIVSSLKSYARQDLEIKKENFNISEVIDDSLEICYNKIKYNVKVEKNIPETIVSAFGDRYQIEQVLINLITNAADAMGGRENSRILISCKQLDNRIKLEVKDNGPGIGEDIINKIFNPFFTSKSRHDNTGLGLSISKSIIEEHGGQLNAENLPEGGAVFSFSVPVSVDKVKESV